MPSPVPRASASPRPRSMRVATSLLALLLAVVGLAAAGAPASSTTTPGTGAASAPAEHLTADATWRATDDEAATGTYDLTLVTGDTVHVTVGADGRQTATVTPAPRPDGSSPSFWTHQRGEDLHVVPQDVAGLLPQRLDPALFNVSALLKQGLADAESSSLPLIVTYEHEPRLRTKAAPSSGPVRRLESVNGLAMRVERDDTRAILAALHRLADGPRARTLTAGPFAGLEKVWLDRPIEAALDESTTRIGAPTAWQQGYDGSDVTVAVLDTGIDTDHPDMAENVVAARNFSNSDHTDDLAGHGTHVASTIAGSGAASEGRYTGVAPGVDLINAKVLDDNGFGSTSDMIDAMEWVSQQGADIANLSIGIQGGYTDGTDPGSLAVNALTEQYGTLFVIAGGNDGPRHSTVTTPGTADRALTVGAVDKNGAIAEFSSRGPRAGDLALKPDITAPGVNIAAARAGGTALCEFGCVQPEDGPIDDHHASASGTSMAAPHVAGAAALIADARPGLSGEQVKAVLMGTATPSDALSIYDQGAGELDVAAALESPVLAAPASVGFGEFRFPHDQREPVERTVTYTNLGAEARTLELTLDAENGDGEPAPDGAVTLSASSLTVPAGGSATVTLTLDTRLPGFGQYGGALVAHAADGSSVRTPVGYYKEKEMYDLHVEGIARDGREAYGRFRVLDVVDGSVDATRTWGQGDDTSCTTDPWAATHCVRIPPGTYSVSGLIATMPQWAPAGQAPGAFGAYLNTSMVTEPEVTIDGATTLTLDAREAVEVQIETPDHATKRNDGAAQQISIYRAPDDGPPARDGLLINPQTQLEERLFVQPTEAVTHGRLAVYTQWQLEAPAITFDVVGSDTVQLNPLYYDRGWFSDNSAQFPMLEGSHQLPVVDAGTATAEEIDGLDLGGALALIRRSDAVPVAEQSNTAAAAGASMVAVYNDVPGPNGDPGERGVPLQVPTVRLSHGEGTGLLQLLQQQPVAIDADGRPVSPYRYNLTYTEQERVPPELHYVADTDQLAAVENSFHSQLSDDLTFTENMFAMQSWEDFSMSFPFPTRGGPQTRTDYYVPTAFTEYLHTIATPEAARWPEPEVNLRSEPRSFQPGERVRQSWLNAPLRPGLWPEDPVHRTHDELRFNLAGITDGDGHVAQTNTSPPEANGGFVTLFRLYADDELVAEGSPGQGYLPVPAGAEDFRIEYDVDNAAPWAKLSTHTRTVWTFASTQPAQGQVRIEPMLTVDYDVDVDLQNRALSPDAGNGAHTVEFTVGHQPGARGLPIRSNASLEVSYDSGDSWRTVRNLREVEDGRFVATLNRRAPEETDGFVSLRMRAEDREGNSVEQEIIRAYGLAAR